MDNIDEPEHYLHYLRMLGGKHVAYEAEPEYLAMMGSVFLGVIHPILENEVRGRTGVIQLCFHLCNAAE